MKLNYNALLEGDDAPKPLGLVLFAVGGIAFVSALIAGLAGLTGMMLTFFGTMLMALAFSLVYL